MTTIKVSNATGPALDWLVAKCEGYFSVHDDPAYWESPPGTKHFLAMRGPMHHPVGWTQASTDWAHAGPIIEREGITTAYCSGDLGEPRSYWVATAEQQGWDYGYGPYHEQQEDKSAQFYKSEVVVGPTPLIAAMRCFCISKLGDTADVPDALL
jgi:hypothetical protein